MTEIPFTVCIPAAGTGMRMGMDVPKQFLEVAGMPVLAHTLSVFNELVECQRVMIAATDEGAVQRLLDHWPMRMPVSILPGGDTRQQSVARMIARCADDEIVLVHDAARPCVRSSDVRAVARAVSEDGAALLALAARDTVKEERDGLVARTVDRTTIWLAQTPQGARGELFKRALAASLRDRYIGTDDVELLERIGIAVRLVPGDTSNIKITTREDLSIAEAILKARSSA